MKKNLFRRVAASFLTLTMLVPCLMTVPASAAEEETVISPIAAATKSAVPDVGEVLYQFIPESRTSDTERISCNLFYNPETAKASNIRYSGSHYMFTDNGIQQLKYMAFYNQTSTNKNYGIPGHYIGSSWIEDCNLQFTIEDMEPIVVGEHEAINLDLSYGFLPYTSTTNSAFSCIMRVYVSVDGKTFLEDYAKVRWTEFLGSGTVSKNSGNDVFFYRMWSENLLDIEGLMAKSMAGVRRFRIKNDGTMREILPKEPKEEA